MQNTGWAGVWCHCSFSPWCDGQSDGELAGYLHAAHTETNNIDLLHFARDLKCLYVNAVSLEKECTLDNIGWLHV